MDSTVQITNKAQHLLKHKAKEIRYLNGIDPNIKNVQDALDELFQDAAQILHWKAPVANVASLPLVGNSVDDARIVENDGSGHPGLFVCIDTVGAVDQQWLQIANINWGVPTLNQSYSGGGNGLGRQITAHYGPVEITVPDASSGSALKINNNDVTNDPRSLEIFDSTQGSSIYINKIDAGDSVEIEQAINSASDAVGIYISATNAGAGGAYAIYSNAGINYLGDDTIVKGVFTQNAHSNNVGSGTVTKALNGFAVSGAGSSFLSEVEVGDQILAFGDTEGRVVIAIADDNNLTLDPYAGIAWAGLSYEIIKPSVRLKNSGGDVFFQMYPSGNASFMGQDGVTSGNVGFGTLAPRRKIHVSVAEPVSITAVAIENTDTTDGNSTVISYRSSTTGAGADNFVEFGGMSLAYQTHDNATSTGVLNLFTRTNNVTSNVVTIGNGVTAMSGNVSITGKLAAGGDASLATAARLWQFDQTITDFAAGASWRAFESIFTLNPSINIAGTTTFSAHFLNSSQAGNIKNIGRMIGASIGAVHNGTGSIAVDIEGLNVLASNTSTATVPSNVGIKLFASNTGNGTLTENVGIDFGVGNSLAGGTIVDNISIRINEGNAAGTVTNNYGIKINDLTIGSNKWAIFTGLGLVQFGDNVGIGVSPNSALDLNGAFNVRGIAAPAVSPSGQGRIYFDSTSKTFKVSQDNGAYVDLVVAGGEAPANATYVTLSSNATLANERVLTGTAHQIILTDNGANSTVVLSTPQDIDTVSSPTFSNITITNRIASGGDASLVTAGQLWDFSQTITTLNGIVQSFPFHSQITLNPSDDPGANIYAHALFKTNVQSGNAKNFNRVQGAESYVQQDGSGNITGQLTGFEVNSVHNGSGTVTLLTGATFAAIAGASCNGTITENNGLRLNVGSGSASAHIVTNKYLYLKKQNFLGTIDNNFGIYIEDMSFGSTSRAIELTGTNVGNAIRFGSSANMYATGADNIRITENTNVGGLNFDLTTTSATINTVTTTNSSIVFQNATLTGSTSAVGIAPSFVSENVAHFGSSFSATQNGANNATLTGVAISISKATGATTLATGQSLSILTPSVSGTITNVIGIEIGDQSISGSTLSFGIRIESQSANATTTRAVELQGTGVSNAIRFGSSANIYSNGASNIRVTDASNTGGLDVNLTTTSVTLNTVTQNTAGIILQNQTFTPGADYNSTTISPTFTAENFLHVGLLVSPTQNGANSNTLRAIGVLMTKATGATVLANMTGISFATPVIAGTVTSSQAIKINDQTNANATASYGINFTTAGVANSILWGGSALQYASAANNIRFADSANDGGIDFGLTSGISTIQTIGVLNNTIALQNQTFTPGASHSAVTLVPLWTAENFGHTALNMHPTQFGANSSGMIGINIVMDKETGATTLASSVAIQIGAVSILGSITNNTGLSIGDQSTAGVVTTGYGINILSQTGTATTSRAIALQGTGIQNGIYFGASATMFSNAANNVRIIDSTAVGGIDINVTATTTTIRTVTVASSGITLQNNSSVTGNTNQVLISPSFAAEDVNHTAMGINPVQNGASANSFTGLTLNMTKLTGATTLATMQTISIGNYSNTGTTTNAFGITIGNQSSAGGTTAFAIRIQSQTANATTTRAIELTGTGVNNAIRFGSSPNIYSGGSNDLRISDVTDVGGLIITTSSTSTTIKTITADTANITLQAQTYTPGAGHTAVSISPTWATENFIHSALGVVAQQNGANSVSLNGINITVAKNTGASTLALMVGLNLNAPSIAGTVTSSFAIKIADQTNAGATTNRAIELVGTTVQNAIRFGSSANMFSNAANNIRVTDSTNASGIDFTLTTTVPSINSTITNSAVYLALQNQTFTPGATHEAIRIIPTWTAENFTHRTLYLSPVQSGTNTQFLIGYSVVLTQSGAGTVTNMQGFELQAPIVGGTVTNNTGLNIGDQSPANVSAIGYGINIETQTGHATTSRAIVMQGSGVANAIYFGSSVNLYLNSSNVLRVTDATNARGIDFTLTAAGVQTISSTAGGLVMGSSSDAIAFFAGSPVSKQVSGANLTNNVTVGGTDDTVDDVTVGVISVVTAADGVTTRNAIYQLARKLKQINDGLRAYNIFT